MVDKVFGTKAFRRKSRREDEHKSHDECMHRVLRLEGRISTMAQLLKEDVLNCMMERLACMTPKIEALEKVLEKFASIDMDMVKPTVMECAPVVPDKVEASTSQSALVAKLKEVSLSTAQLAQDTKALNKEVSLSTAQMSRDTEALNACPFIRMDEDDSDGFTEGSNYVVDRADDCEEWWGRSSNSWQDPPQNDVRIELEELQYADTEARGSARAETELEKEMAIKIQSWFRGYLARQRPVKDYLILLREQLQFQQLQLQELQAEWAARHEDIPQVTAELNLALRKLGFG